MEIIDALKLVIARSPRAGEQALRAIAAARNGSPVLGIRYINVLIMALGDPDATFTPDERALIASAIETETPEGESRGFTLRVRLTDAERASLQAAADESGMSMSEFVRRKIFS